jgi:ABC-type uncharacterized transport system substrate-binding protein
MNRRALITLLGGAAAWPVTARAQQPTTPLIGFLHPTAPESNGDRLRAFYRGLKEAGYIEGENVAIMFRWAENAIERLPELATELARRQVAVMVAPQGTASALAAKAATTTIPIIFNVSEDPVRRGLVASLARPGGNATGINFFSGELVAKRLELLRELLPAMTNVAVLVNPSNVANTEITVRDAEAAGRTMGLQVTVLKASSGSEIGAAFATLERQRPDALFVGGDAVFTSRRVQLATLAVRHAVPMLCSGREYVEVGGLISYGANITDTWREVGAYAGRILRGAKPEDLPVLQASKFELVINAETARMLAIALPPTLLALADEVIE